MLLLQAMPHSIGHNIGLSGCLVGCILVLLPVFEHCMELEALVVLPPRKRLQNCQQNSSHCGGSFFYGRLPDEDDLHCAFRVAALCCYCCWLFGSGYDEMRNYHSIPKRLLLLAMNKRNLLECWRHN